DPAPARHRRNRLRADPLCRQAPVEPRADGAARARALAAAPDDAPADARPDRGLDPGSPGRARAREAGGARGAPRRSDGVAERPLTRPRAVLPTSRRRRTRAPRTS